MRTSRRPFVAWAAGRLPRLSRARCFDVRSPRWASNQRVQNHLDRVGSASGRDQREDFLNAGGFAGDATRQSVASPTMRPTLSTAQSQLMIDAAITEANRTSVSVTVVVVDESGVLLALLRMDGAPLVSVQTAINKAYSAAAIGMAPDDFYAAIQSDPAAVTEFGTRPGLALTAGGLPVVTGGRVADAVGVAGAMTAAQDRQVAEVAITHAHCHLTTP